MIGGGAGSRTRVQNKSGIRSFTSLFSFSKLTKYPQIFPSPMRPWRSTHPYSRYFSDTNEVTILVLFVSVGPTTYPALLTR